MENLSGFVGLLCIWGLLYGFYAVSVKGYGERD